MKHLAQRTHVMSCPQSLKYRTIKGQLIFTKETMADGVYVICGFKS
jgi:hypothetical protein